MERKSNIELLRIICFLMIVTLHISPIGLVVEKGINPGTFSYYSCILIRLFVSSAVLTFVAIGGYVSLYGKYNNKKTLKRIFIPVLVYLPFYIYRTCINYGLKRFSSIVSLNVKHFVTFNGSYYHLWFLVVYFVTIILFKYIRIGMDKYSRKENLYFIIFLLIITSLNTFYPLIKVDIFKDFFFNYLLSFIAIYSAGYYINKYDVKINKCICLLLMLIVYIVFSFFFREISSANGSLFFNYLLDNNFFMKILSILWLLLFKDINIKSKVINNVASLTFGAYIIHVFFISIVMKYINLYSYFNHKYYVLIMGGFIVLVFFSSLITELIRKTLVKGLKRIRNI